MPTVFTHTVLAVATVSSLPKGRKSFKLFFIAILAASIPDLDVIAFRIGIPYGHFFGHRGFSHSILFAVIIGFIFGIIFFRKERWLRNSIILSFVTVTHSLFDALTDGGLGVALLSPFNNSRLFFPWRPIPVASISISRFFTSRGVTVLTSEILMVWLPLLVIVIMIKIYQRTKQVI